MTLSNTSILGALIAGGRASRFGSDKAAAAFRDVPLIEHAARAIAPWVRDTVVVGRAWPGFASIADRPAPGLGPLGGIAAAMIEARARGLDAVLTIGCDMPSVPSSLFRALVDQGFACCADAPILGLWPSALGPALEAHLAAGGPRAIHRWAAANGISPVPAPVPLPNINTPADLLAL